MIEYFNNLGATYLNQKDYFAAMKCFRKSLELLFETCDKERPTSVTFDDNRHSFPTAAEQHTQQQQANQNDEEVLNGGKDFSLEQMCSTRVHEIPSLICAKPLQIPKPTSDKSFVCPTLVSCIVMFNMALSHHLQVYRQDNLMTTLCSPAFDYLMKAISLYQHAHHLLTHLHLSLNIDENAEMIPQVGMAICNNMAQIHSEHNHPHCEVWCHRLSGWMTIDGILMNDEVESVFLRNMSILLHHPAAAA